MLTNVDIKSSKQTTYATSTLGLEKSAFKYDKILITFSSGIEYSINGKTNILKNIDFTNYSQVECDDNLDACTKTLRAKYNTEEFSLMREISYNPEIPSSFRTRMIFKNTSINDICLSSLSPFEIYGEENFNLAGIDPKNWLFFTQGRHKNDTPLVLNMGAKHEELFEVLANSYEMINALDYDNENAIKFTSDQMSVIKASQTSKESVLIGFLTGADQLVDCTLTMGLDNSFKSIEARCLFDIIIEPQREVHSEWVRIDCQPDYHKAIDEFATDKGMVYKGLRSQNPPSVYCTWYYYGMTVTYDDVILNLNELKSKSIPFDVFQIDDGWEIAYGDWTSNKKFPQGMKKLAENIKTAGYVPGIWTCPFIVHEASPIAIEHPDWLLYSKNGDPCIFNVNNLKSFILDITNPKTLKWLEELYSRLTYDWGFKYHKLDFTRASVIQKDAVYFDNTITLAQAYRRAMQTIRDAVGNECYILNCGGLFDPVIGLVNGQRTGSDVLSMWSKSISKVAKKPPFTIKQNTLRYWMNNWWDNDPDALLIRRNNEPIRDLPVSYGLLNDEEVKTLALSQYFGGGIVCSTEPIKDIDKDRLYVLRHIIPVVNVKPITRDIFSGDKYPSVIDVNVINKGWHTVAIINWSDEDDMECNFNLDENIVGSFAKEHDSFIVSEFFSGKIIYDVKYSDRIDIGNIKPHGAILVKISPSNSLPAIIHSDSHFSMGAEVECLEISDNNLKFKLDLKFDYPATYKIKLPEGIRPSHDKNNIILNNDSVNVLYKDNLVVIQLNKKQYYDIKIPCLQI